ncbi:hypothetical protein [Candidatus Contendibacter odensensis]|uniref:hypothetical protein n=1 Tax=Candidatus Contendibacter odensensis TaxID=1400860 RepID=UPI00055897AB|nr:hypothetical protein [Candidatus Contendobacter odensis]MBK8753530.1 hypothetical protein [Candidatus Competibacteraceae bacterium]
MSAIENLVGWIGENLNLAGFILARLARIAAQTNLSRVFAFTTLVQSRNKITKLLLLVQKPFRACPAAGNSGEMPRLQLPDLTLSC